MKKEGKGETARNILTRKVMLFAPGEETTGGQKADGSNRDLKGVEIKGFGRQEKRKHQNGAGGRHEVANRATEKEEDTREAACHDATRNNGQLRREPCPPCPEKCRDDENRDSLEKTTTQWTLLIGESGKTDNQRRNTPEAA